MFPIPRIIASIFVLSSVVSVSACGEDTTPVAEEDPTVALAITVSDPAPLSVLWNKDDVVCTTNYPLTPEIEILQIQVKDDTAKIVAAEELSNGLFTEGTGCAGGVKIDVPQSDFYEVTVSDGAKNETRTVTVERDGSTANTEVTF